MKEKQTADMGSPEYAPSPAQANEFTEADARRIAIEALRAKTSSSIEIMRSVLLFSLVNVVLISLRSPFNMAFGLHLSDAIATGVRIYGYHYLLGNALLLGFYFGLSLLAKKHPGWLLVLMASYAIDGIIPFVFRNGTGFSIWAVIGLAVHAYVLYLLWNGLSAAFAARKLERMPNE